METQLTLTRTPASIKFLHGSFLLLTTLANICDVEKMELENYNNSYSALTRKAVMEWQQQI